jgi:hypothetical protein
LETLFVVDYMIKISKLNFTKLIVKFGSKPEFCWKLGELKWILKNHSEVSRNLLGHIIFLKGYDAGFPKISKFLINYWFEKNFNGGSLCTGGVAGIRAVVNLSSTDYGEIIIFGFSKYQTTRNWSTLMNLEQIWILVTYLFICIYVKLQNISNIFHFASEIWLQMWKISKIKMDQELQHNIS